MESHEAIAKQQAEQLKRRSQAKIDMMQTHSAKVDAKRKAQAESSAYAAERAARSTSTLKKRDQQKMVKQSLERAKAQTRREDAAQIYELKRLARLSQDGTEKEAAQRSQSALRKREQIKLEADQRTKMAQKIEMDERALLVEQQKLAQAEFEADEATRLKTSLKVCMIL